MSQRRIQLGAAVQPPLLHHRRRVGQHRGRLQRVALGEDEVRDEAGPHLSVAVLQPMVGGRVQRGGAQHAERRHSRVEPQPQLLVQPEPRHDMQRIGIGPQQQSHTRGVRLPHPLGRRRVEALVEGLLLG